MTPREGLEDIPDVTKLEKKSSKKDTLSLPLRERILATIKDPHSVCFDGCVDITVTKAEMRDFFYQGRSGLKHQLEEKHYYCHHVNDTTLRIKIPLPSEIRARDAFYQWLSASRAFLSECWPYIVFLITYIAFLASIVMSPFAMCVIFWGIPWPNTELEPCPLLTPSSAFWITFTFGMVILQVCYTYCRGDRVKTMLRKMHKNK